ncbi:MAG: NTP transferase domain-containing protein, partial [Desulfovibrionaceae bacterium]|nr:NTP transferase domain-containing protein [Desulfovibrionaceae bacterium]
MNAIILCAGRGVRFRPLSLVRPKSLTPVDGVPLLEHTLGLLRRHGVERITVVTGYMADHFQYLKDAFSVELIRNPLFAATNNNTSLALVRDRLQDSLIIDGDLFFLEDFFPHVRPDHAQFISQPTTHGLEWELRLDAARR